MRFTRPYDYQRGKCEDPAIIEPWFQLVKNMRMEHGIQDCDFYNFDETGFQIGLTTSRKVITHSDRVGKPMSIQPGNRELATAICCIAGDGYVMPPFLVVKGQNHLGNWYSKTDMPDDWLFKTTENGWTDNETGLDWLKHFDEYSKRRRKGAYRMLVLDGHDSHVNAKFEDYCKENNIITLCLPPHSSQVTQLLDVGCFAPLKTRYSTEIGADMKNEVSHITKAEFFVAFKKAFYETFTKKNVQGGFRGAGPFNPEVVLSKLKVRLRTPTPPGTADGPPESWVSKTPQTAREAILQSIFIKDRIARHESSPAPTNSAVDKLAKGMLLLFHDMELMKADMHDLREQNAGLSIRRRVKRTRLQDGGVIKGSRIRKLVAEKGVVEEEERVEEENEGSSKRRRTGPRHCGIGRKTVII